MGLGSVLRDAVFPPLCPVTGAETDRAGTLSPAAWAEMTFLSGGTRCGACGRAIPGGVGADLLCDVCTAHPRPWAQGAAAFVYDGAGRAMLLSFKHGDRLDLAPLIAGWMLRAAPESVARADLIVPVPLHWRRLLGRRFNQAAELARGLAGLAGQGRAYAPALLERGRATPSQAGRDRAARTANLAGAIRPARDAVRRMAGRRVLLVDDVMTTGATLEACTRACREAGAGRVDVLVSALVPFDGVPYLPGNCINEE